MSRQMRLFSRLVRTLFPADFRADYESEMTRTFRAQQRDAHSGGIAPLARLWRETVCGLVRTAPREHLAQLRQDAHYALRTMRRTPAFTAIAIVTLATGIGANTAIFSVVNAVLLRPLPYAESDRLAMLWNRGQRNPKSGLSNPELLDFRERLKSVDVAASAGGAVNLIGHGEPERLKATYVTVGYLQVLGVQPRLGRALLPGEERTGDGRVAVLTHDTWARLFRSDAAAIGKRLTLDGEPHTVVGVLPAAFVLPHEFDDVDRSALLLPLPLDAAASRVERGSHYLRAVARVRGGFTMAQAQAEIDAMTSLWFREYDGEYDAGFGSTLWPVQTDVVGDVRPALLLLVGAVGLVLLIACANVANLLLARGQVRAREIAVRKAVGASRARLVRQVLTESVILATASSVAGIALARWLTTLLARTAAGVPRLDEVGLDPFVLAFTAGTALLTALVFGSLPALDLARRDTTADLTSTRGTRSSMGRAVRSGLVTAQVALALVLLVGAALLVESFVKLRNVPAGFRPDHVLTFRVALPLEGFAEREPVVRFIADLLSRFSAMPDVTAAGATAGLPLQTEIGDWDFYLPGETPGPHGSDRAADWQVVTPGYFEAMGVDLLRGRFPAATDTERSQAVVVINDALARTYFAGRDPVGQQIRMSGGARPWLTIIGVCADLRHTGLSTPANAQVFLPHAQFKPFWRDTTVRSVSIAIRTTGDPLAVASTARARLREVDPNLPISQVMTMDAILERSVAPRRLQMLLLAVFGAIALILASTGTYGVLAYQITERTREFGVRMALGATSRDILRMVIRQGMAPAIAGVAIGLGGAMVLTRLLSTLLFETEPLDVSTFAAASGVLLVSALVACCVPARRASHVDPSTALRTE